MNKRKTGSAPLNTRAAANLQEMKEDDIKYYSESAAISTLSKEWGTAMSKLVKAMTPLCSIYDVAFKNFEKEPELGVGEDLTKTVIFCWWTHRTTYKAIDSRRMRRIICLV